MNHVLEGFEKAAGFGGAIAKGVASVGKQLSGGAGKTTMKRMKSHALWGAGIGAGGSMLQQKMRGEDVSLGRAAAGAALGAGAGALSGTTMVSKLRRKAFAPASTQSQSFAESINPKGWFKKTPNVTSVSGGRKIVSKGRTAFGNLSPLEKGFLGYNVAATAKDLKNPESQGHRGEILGGSAGMTAATMAGSRWKAMRHGGLGGMAKSLGLYIGTGMAGSTAGRLVDRKMHPEEQDA